MKVFIRLRDVETQSQVMVLCAANGYEVTQDINIADVFITDSLKAALKAAKNNKRVILFEEDYFFYHIKRYHPELLKDKIFVVPSDNVGDNVDNENMEDEILRILARIWFELHS